MHACYVKLAQQHDWDKGGCDKCAEGFALQAVGLLSVQPLVAK